MALKIRLRQQGRKNRRMFRLVVADERSKRDGKYLEALGWYNPHADELENKLFINASKVEEWLAKGAQLSDSSRTLVAKGAPELMQQLLKQETERRVKRTQKRRDSRRRRAEKKKALKDSKPADQKAAPKAETKTGGEKKPAVKKPAVKKAVKEKKEN